MVETDLQRGRIRHEPLCYTEAQFADLRDNNRSTLWSQKPFSSSNRNDFASQSDNSTLRNGSIYRVLDFRLPQPMDRTPPHVPTSNVPLSDEYQEYIESFSNWIE